MNATRVTSRAGAAAVAGIAAVASYAHMRELAAANGQSGTLAALVPLSVDGLLVVAAVAMADDRAAGLRPRLSARLSFVTGVGVSIVANTLAAPDTLLARAISAWPAVALLLVVEMLSRAGKPVPVSTVDVDDEPPADPWHYATPIGPEPPAEPVRARRPQARSLTAAERVTAAHTKRPDATHEQLAKLARVSVSTVKRHRPTGSPSGLPPAETRINGSVPDLEAVSHE